MGLGPIPATRKALLRAGLDVADLGQVSAFELRLKNETLGVLSLSPVPVANFTAEGEATAHVLAEALSSRGIRVTRLARGVPIGSELEYVDLGTIAHALVDRR